MVTWRTVEDDDVAPLDRVRQLVDNDPIPYLQRGDH